MRRSGGGGGEQRCNGKKRFPRSTCTRKGAVHPEQALCIPDTSPNCVVVHKQRLRTWGTNDRPQRAQAVHAPAARWNKPTSGRGSSFPISLGPGVGSHGTLAGHAAERNNNENTWIPDAPERDKPQEAAPGGPRRLPRGPRTERVKLLHIWCRFVDFFPERASAQGSLLEVSPRTRRL